jgi:hypothetical protein
MRGADNRKPRSAYLFDFKSADVRPDVNRNLEALQYREFPFHLAPGRHGPVFRRVRVVSDVVGGLVHLRWGVFVQSVTGEVFFHGSIVPESPTWITYDSVCEPVDASARLRGAYPGGAFDKRLTRSCTD